MAQKFKNYMFIERISQLREERRLPQRKFAETLDIDSVTCCKIEKGERKAKRKQVLIISKLQQTDKKELLSLWLADQVIAKVLDIAKQNINKKCKI